VNNSGRCVKSGDPAQRREFYSQVKIARRGFCEQISLSIFHKLCIPSALLAEISWQHARHSATLRAIQFMNTSIFNRFFLILISGLASAAPAQTSSGQHSPALAEARPVSVGMSSERLARIDALCQKAVADNDIPGVVALVARRGKIVYYKSFGLADNASGRKLQRDDIFRIASQTKAITATAVMMLWEEGRFRLDDPISMYLPEFKQPQLLKTFDAAQTNYTTEAAKSEITIRQLLDHTSGLGYGVSAAASIRPTGHERHMVLSARAECRSPGCRPDQKGWKMGAPARDVL
jgi:hypothetical protein